MLGSVQSKWCVVGVEYSTKETIQSRLIVWPHILVNEEEQKKSFGRPVSLFPLQRLRR